jgi:ATP-dependent exoDNAse (exonuclease V) beta subunit
MTLHRAKGLEFDTVIIPGLGRTTPRGNAALLRWRQRPDGVLLAPMRPRGGDKDPVYEYLAMLEREEEDAESGRLLYVGCTRAKEHLHLIAALDTKMDAAGVMSWKSPSGASALAKLWEAVTPGPPQLLARPAPSQREPPLLRRLPTAWQAPTQAQAVTVPSYTGRHDLGLTPAFDWARETARHIGTVAHRVFKQIGEEGLEAWPEERIGALEPRLAAELAGEGVAASDMRQAIALVQRALRGCLADPRGQWLFASGHREAHNEYALTAIRDGELVNVVLDRTFVDAEGTHWIVDFKFSQHEGAGLDAFLDSERERYRAQLEGYADALRTLDERPLRLGLYFPLLAGWRELPVPR